MEIENIKIRLNEVLGETVYKHSVLTADTALKLAVFYGSCPKKAEIAGLLHDCAKFMTEKEQIKLLEDTIFETELEKVPKVLHGPCGAIIAKRDYEIEDEEILDAVRYHVFGRPEMGLLEKIIFIADSIEPSRNFPRIEELREIAFKNIDKAVLMSLEGTQQKILDNKELWYEGSKEALEYYKELTSIRVGKEYTVDIENMTHEGRGVARIDDFVIFIDGVITGEIVEIKIIHKTKKYAIADCTKIIKTVEERVESFCKVYGVCGGCSLQHLRYDMQLKFKQNHVNDCLARIGGFKNIRVSPTKGMTFPYRYRNNVQYQVVDGKAGFYKKRSRKIVEHRTCAIQYDEVNEIMNHIKQFLAEHIRHIVFRSGTGGIMMIIVSREKNPDLSELVKHINEKYSLVKTIVLNTNDKETGVVLGSENVILYGDGEIIDRLRGVEYVISPNSFYQINTEQTKVLYSFIDKFIGLEGSKTVYDLYCGIGSISLHLAKKAKKVIGVESVKTAVDDAIKNAEHNKITNVEFVCGKVEDVAGEMVKKYGRPSVVIVDPPRKGCEREALKAIRMMRPNKIIYVSCNPSTLARDLKILCENKRYSIKKVQPVDMFPFTSHVETVVLLERK